MKQAQLLRILALRAFLLPNAGRTVRWLTPQMDLEPVGSAPATVQHSLGCPSNRSEGFRPLSPAYQSSAPKAPQRTSSLHYHGKLSHPGGLGETISDR